MRKLIPALIFAILTTNFSMAANQANDSRWKSELTDTVEYYSFKPIGKTKFSFLFWDIYESKLLTTSGIFPLLFNDEKLLYEIKYLKTISAESLLEKTAEQWHHLGYPTTRYKVYLSALAEIWPDIQTGDTLTLVTSKENSAFYHNNKLTGIIDDPEFSDTFLDIWLSEKTSEPTLRDELLGINSNG